MTTALEASNLIADMPEPEYRALPGLSGTEVAKILDNPADLKWERDNPEPSTKAQNLGTIVHAIVLGQPLEVVVSEFETFRTKAAQEWKAEQEALGLTVVKADEMEHATKVAAAVMSHSTARELLTSDGDSEVTVTGEYRGHPLKGRIDRLPKVGPVIDLKSARDPYASALSKSLASPSQGGYGYALQLGHYALLAERPERPYIIAVRNEGRPAVAVHRIDAVTWDLALQAVQEAWNRYADCMDSGVWPDTGTQGDIGLRTWAYNALEAQIAGDIAGDTITELEHLIGDQA